MAIDVTEIKIRDKVTIAGSEITSVESTLTGSSTAIPRADAVKGYVDNVLSASDAMVFKGTIGTGGTVTALPTTHSAGWTYRVITAGTYAGVTAEVGDLIIAVIDRSGSSNANSDWTIVQTNIDGAVTGPASAVSGNVASFNGTGGKIIQDSGVAFETTLTTNSDAKAPTSKAVATYVTGLGYLPTTGGTITGDLYGKAVDNDRSLLYRWGGLFLTWDSDTYGANPEHSLRSTYGDNYGDHITLNSFGHIRMNIDSNNNGTNNFEIGSHTTGTTNTLFTVQDTGNVGIGTSTPATKLDVAGGVDVQGNIRLTGTATTTNQSRTIEFTGFDKEGTTDFSDAAFIRHTVNTGGHSGSVLEISSQNDSTDGIAFTTNASSQVRHNGHVMWDANNDGSGSGLDADLLDGQQGSYFLDTSGSTQTKSGSLNVSGNFVSSNNITGGRYYQSPNGIPTNNLGSPTVTEMSLFDEQFYNQTNFYDISKLKFYTSTDGTTWTEVTTISDTNKRALVGGDAGSSIVIPNLTPYYRIEITNNGSYVFLNALYMYWSSNSHSTTVKIRARRRSDETFVQWTNSSTTVSAWPGHLYMPFSTIPFLTGGTSSGHYDIVQIDFQPTWAGGAYSGTSINLYKLQIWGGYPAGKRNIYSTDENRNVAFPAALTGTRLFSTIATGTSPLSVTSTTVNTNLNADLLDGYHASSLVLKAGDTMSGTLNIEAGNNTYGLSTGLSLRLGLDTADKAGAIRLDGTTDGAYGLIQETDSNLHIDAVGGKTYINYYDGDTVMFGNGASGVVAVMGPDGDLWKGSADNTGSVYWHAGNDGAGSGLDADLIDGISFRNGNSTNGINPDSINENGTGYITSVSLYGQTDGALYSQAYNTSWVHQIYGDYRTGSLAVRGRNNGTLTSWRTVWDSGNDGTGSTLDADLLDGNHASAFYLASNPSGYTSNTGTVTSVGGTGTVAGLTLTGTVTTTGNLTLGGTLSTPVSTINDSTTVGQNLVKLTNPSAIRFIRINADNTVTALSDSDFRTAIGAGTSSTTGTVTSVGGTGTVAGLTLTGTVTTSGNLTLGGTLSTPVSTINDSTTVGQNLVKLANPSAIRFIRVNADNTVSALSDSDFRTAIGAGTSSTTGTVTSVSAGTQISGMSMTITNGTTTPSIATSISNAANFRTAIGAGTGNGTVTSVGGTGTVAGLTLSGTVTTSGNLTLSGTLSTPVSTINDSTTVGQNLVKLTNPSAITFLRVNADNTVTARSAADFRTDIGAPASSSVVTLTGAQSISGVKTFSNSFTGAGTNRSAVISTSLSNGAIVGPIDSSALYISATGTDATNHIMTGITVEATGGATNAVLDGYGIDGISLSNTIASPGKWLKIKPVAGTSASTILQTNSSTSGSITVTLPSVTGTLTTGSGTTNELSYWSGSGTLATLSTATYPSLTELSYVKGVTSAIQTQLNGKQATLTNPVTGTGTTNQITYWTGTNTVGTLSTATYPSLTELSYVKGVTSAIQTQINGKADISHLGALELVYSGTTTVTHANATDTTTITLDSGKTLGSTDVILLEVDGANSATTAGFTKALVMIRLGSNQTTANTPFVSWSSLDSSTTGNSRNWSVLCRYSTSSTLLFRYAGYHLEATAGAKTFSTIYVHRIWKVVT